MFSDGLGDLIVDRAGRKNGKTFTKIDLKAFQEIFKCANGSAQKTFKLLMTYRQNLSHFKLDDCTIISTRKNPFSSEINYKVAPIGLSLSEDELDKEQHGN